MKDSMNYEEITDYLESQHSFHELSYLRNALALLKLHIDPEKVILIAGTNGKGTTGATLQTLLHSAGKNVGFFSSPHLEEATERIKFNCRDISKEDFCKIFNYVYEKTQSLQLSYFEHLTLMASYYFFECQKDLDFAILEVGLGGTFDATNIIPHKYCIITSISFDHEDILGNNLIDISKNKFGIISQNNIVFHTSFPVEIQSLIPDYAAKFNAKFIQAYDYSMHVDTSGEEPIFSVSTKIGDFVMNLPGKRAAENSVLALTAFDNLVGNSCNFLKAIKQVYWPGRMERIIYNHRRVYFSGDHNVDGVRSLIDLLKYYKYDAVHFVVGICFDKRYNEMLAMLQQVPRSHLYLTETPIKTLSIKKYGDFLKTAEISTPDPALAFQKALAKSQNSDIIITTGSLYLVGALKKF